MRVFLLLLLALGGLTSCSHPGNGRLVTSQNELGMSFHSEVDAAGRKHGVERVFYSNGRLAKLLHYQHGRQHGRAFSFVPAAVGALDIDQIAYYRHGQQHGRVYGFYDAGTLRTVQDWVAGEPWGEAYFFDERGHLQCREHYGSHRQVVRYRCYDAAGRLMRAGRETPHD